MVNTNFLTITQKMLHVFYGRLKAFDLVFFPAAVIPSSEMPNKLNGIFHVIVQSSLFLDDEISKNNTDSSSKEVKEKKKQREIERI